MFRVKYCLLALLLVLAACQPAGLPASNQPAFTVITHPDGPLYVGDQVSFEVLPSEGSMANLRVQVRLDQAVLGESGFEAYGVGARNEAVLWWIWDTRLLAAGRHTLTFTILPDGPSWTETYRLRRQEQAPGFQSTWESTTNACCTIHYISGTEAERDLAALQAAVDEKASAVESRLGVEFPERVTITLLPRTLGHGGFASDGIYVSYLDRNYAGSSSAQVIQHELVHILDARIGGEYRPAMLVEGLAVFISGGHFKPEDLMPRAAALFPLGGYIPLRTLADDFYRQQHESGYLEAAALVQYLVERFGWEAYHTFHRQIPAPAGRSDADVLDAALQDFFGIQLIVLEADFIAHLQAQEVSAAALEDLRLTILFYDTVRSYQEQLDPSAYFLTAWLPDGNRMLQQGIVADLLRHPQSLPNWQIEAMLLQADRDYREGDTAAMERSLRGAAFWLDVYSP